MQLITPLLSLLPFLALTSASPTPVRRAAAATSSAAVTEYLLKTVVADEAKSRFNGLYLTGFGDGSTEVNNDEVGFLDAVKSGHRVSFNTTGVTATRPDGSPYYNINIKYTRKLYTLDLVSVGVFDKWQPVEINNGSGVSTGGLFYLENDTLQFNSTAGVAETDAYATNSFAGWMVCAWSRGEAIPLLFMRLEGQGTFLPANCADAELEIETPVAGFGY